MIFLNQTLHGYSEGHRLLATSLRLPGESQRAMRLLSDLSGSRITEGFDEYLTGYFLPDGQHFCLAKTWYAYECPRPGCVWTHSLLISSDSLRKLNCLTYLMPYFQRPLIDSYSTYSNELSIDIAQDSTYSYSAPHYASQILKLLYSDNSQIVIPLTEAKLLEEVHLALWRLVNVVTRVPYQFCTGSIQLRNAAVRNFDIQTIPQESLREIYRSNRNITIFENFNTSDHSEWTGLLLDEMRGKETLISEFLQEYCNKYNRENVGSYVRVYVELSRQGSDYNSLIEMISFEFPDSSEAVKLKIAVAGGSAARKIRPNVPEAVVLQAIMQPYVAEAFSSSGLDVVERFTSLWLNNERTARDVAKVALKVRSINADKVCDKLYEMLSPISFGLLLSREHDIAMDLVFRKPQLAIQRDVWNNSPQIADQVATFVCKSKIFTEEEISRIISIQIESLTPNVASTMVEAYPVIAANTLIEWLTQYQDKIAPIEWKQLIENNTELTGWMRQSVNSCVFSNVVIRLISPASELAKSVKISKWLSVSQKCSLDCKELSGLHTMLFCLSFENTNDAEALLIESFPRIYSRVEQGALPENLWQILSVYLPPAGWWWDKCKRMRAGLVKKCAYGEVSREAFIACMSNGQMLIDIITMWGWDYQEQKYIGNVLRDIGSHKLAATNEIVEISQKYVHWFSS